MEQTYPLLSARIQSTFIDLVVVLLLMLTLTGILDQFKNVPDWVPIVLLISVLAYGPVCTSLGCTLGNYIKKIRIRQMDDPTKRINFFQALIRVLVKTFLGWISFLTINSNPQRRAIHDMVAGSVMVNR